MVHPVGQSTAAAGSALPSYTPGPWSVRKTDATYQVESAAGIKIVSTSWHSHLRKPYPLKREALANATLAAAAPDLLEALKIAAVQFRHYEALHLAKGTQDADEKAHRNHELAKGCEAAIAKAEGR